MKKFLTLIVTLIMMLAGAALAESAPCGFLNVDSSQAADGYIVVRRPETEKRLTVTVGREPWSAEYPLDDEMVTLPLQFGNGNYLISLYGSSEDHPEPGSLLDSVQISVKMDNPLSCFLHPNLYVRYDSGSPWVLKAEELTAGLTDPKEQYEAISDYIVNNYAYSFIKSVTEQPDALPDIQDCWDQKMGISQDLAALGCAMLRCRGIPAMLFTGSQKDGITYSWVVAVVNQEFILFDPTERVCASEKTDLLFSLYRDAMAY